MKRNTSRWAAVLVAALLIGLGIGQVSVANAGTASSATGYFTVYGINYYNSAVIITSSGQVAASTRIGSNSGIVSTGWVGARARMFNSGGSLVQESSNYYNSIPVYSISVPTNRSAYGTWYSYGVTYSWNGGGYSPYYTYLSPNQNS